MGIHRHLLKQAESVNSTLHRAIEETGQVSLRVREDRPFPEVLSRAIAGQQLSVVAARTIWGRVLERFENSRSKELMNFLRRVDATDLRASGLSGAKAKTLKGIADAVAGGKLAESRLRRLSADGRAQALTELWGVGQWTADMMNIFYFGERDVWPDGDVTARKTLQRLAAQNDTVAVARQFAPYRSYLAMHMWRCADRIPN